MYQAVEQRPLRLSFGRSVADYDQDAGQNLEMVARTPEPFHATFHIRIEVLRVRKIAPALEYHLCRLGGDLAARAILSWGWNL